MKKNFLCILMIGCFLGICLAAGNADAGPSAVEQQLQIMREQMEQMQKKMMELERELQSAQQNAAQAQVQSQQTSQQMSEVAGKFKVLDDLQAKFGHIKLNGYVRSRWWQSESSQNSFDVTEIAMNVRYDVSENISGEFHLWYHPSGNNTAVSEYNNWAGPTTFFEAAFAEFRNLNIGPVNGTLIAGKTRNQAFGIVPGGNYAGRVTSDYSLFHESVNISRITGIQYLTSYQNFKWNFAVFNGWGYGNQNFYGARDANIMKLGVSQENTDEDSNKAFSTRLAYTFQRNEAFDKLELGTSYLTQNLSNSDIDNINRIMGSPLTRDRDRKDEKFGFDVALDKGPFLFKAEYMRGSTADVNADYWYVMPGFLLSKVSKIPLDFFLRYSVADFDETRVASTYTIGTNPRQYFTSGAWDKSQWTPAMVYHIHPKAKLYFEYYINNIDEPSGIRNQGNDYAFVELILFY